MPELPSSTAAPPEKVSLTPLQEDLVNILRNIGGPLFALLDTTRDPLRILATLRGSGENFQSLYEGMQGRMLDAYAPYLVQLPGDSPLLEKVVAEGWGKHWGIFVVSGADFKTLRKHFRTFLMVTDPEGKQLYFRYYDPRVLRVYLPTCNATESEFVFGPVAAYLCEGERADTLMVFQAGDDSVKSESVKLSGTIDEVIGTGGDSSGPETAFLKSVLSE
jgi:Domain of unknown function (DUF4123)